MMEISLALGGGGIKGIAHIGAIRKLENEGFVIKAIAGTSIGGLIGSVYAAGYSADDIENIILGFDQTKMFSHGLIDSPSLFGLQGISQALTHILHNKTFDELMPLFHHNQTPHAFPRYGRISKLCSDNHLKRGYLFFGAFFPETITEGTTVGFLRFAEPAVNFRAADPSRRSSSVIAARAWRVDWPMSKAGERYHAA
jgi:hypothetical protein